MKASKGNHRRSHPVPMRHRLCAALVVVMVACAAPAWAQRNDTPQGYSISAGSLADALDQLAAQSKVQIIYPADLVRGMRSPAISGWQDWRQALEKLLAGSGLEWQLVNETTVAIRKAPSSGLPASFDFDIPAGDLRTALNFFSSQSGIEVLYPADELAGKQGRALRGHMPWPDALARLLQWSGFGYRRAVDGSVVIERTAVPSPATTTLGEVVVTGTRIRGGTSASPVITIDSENIREEGFTNLGEVIRSIPQNFGGGQNPGVAAGAETGAAGIANRNVTGGSALNLRGLGPDASLTLLNGRRFAYGGYTQTVDIAAIPVEAVDRVEVVADGASAIYGSDAVGGVANVILRRDYEGVTIGVLYGATARGGMGAREYTATAGTAWSNGGFIATYKRASVDPIGADQRDYTAGMLSPITIYPGSELRSGLFSLHQSLGPAVELRLDALHTGRDQFSYGYYSGIADSYSRFEPQTRTTLVAPALEVALPNDWRFSLGASWGRDERILQEFRISTTTGEGARSPYDDCFCNRSRTYEVGAEGPLFRLGGGDARLAVGAGYRWNGFTDRLLTTGDNRIEGAVGSRFAYAELGMPLLGGGADAAGDSARLSLTAAVRREDYDGFGSVATPKLGLVYDPTGDYTLKASWGRSFKAPTLLQQFQDKVSALYPAGSLGGDPGRTVIGTSGGNPLLEPERARTWTASLAVHPRALPALEAELTVFDIDYTDRVVQPIGNFSQALINPIYSRYVILDPTIEQQADVIESTTGFYNYSGMPYDPGNVEAVLLTHFVNVARQRVKGVDLSGSFWLDVGVGRLALRGSASWLESKQKNGSEEAPFDLAGTLFSPAKLNSRAGLVWLQGGFTASAFANYTSGVRDVLPGFKTASFTTVDVNLRYSLDDSAGARSGWDFVLSARNLFDRPPPLHPTLDPTWAPYDSTNFSAIGRYLSVSVARRF